MFLTKPSQTVPFLFPNLSKISPPESTCAVCKFLQINDLIFQFLIRNLSITGAKTRCRHELLAGMLSPKVIYCICIFCF